MTQRDTTLPSQERIKAAKASKARKAAEAKQLADENEAMSDMIKNTGAWTDNDVTDDAAGAARIEVCNVCTAVDRVHVAVSSGAQRGLEPFQAPLHAQQLHRDHAHTSTHTDTHASSHHQPPWVHHCDLSNALRQAAAASKARKEAEAEALAKENADFKAKLKATAPRTDDSDGHGGK